MDKIFEFGRRALSYVRIVSGYEERRIRSFRLELEKRLKQAEERKAAIRKIPEQAILGEVRRMVEEMQTLNRKLEETESAIEEYFKPIDKEADALMKIQLEAEEGTMKNMVKVMQQQALFEKAEAGKVSSILQTDENRHSQNIASDTTPQNTQLRDFMRS